VLSTVPLNQIITTSLEKSADGRMSSVMPSITVLVSFCRFSAYVAKQLQLAMFCHVHDGYHFTDLFSYAKLLVTSSFQLSAKSEVEGQRY